MVWVIAVLFVLLGIMIWLLLAPITICIDTLANEYYIKVKGVCKISLNTARMPMTIDTSLPIRKFSFSPFEQRRKHEIKAQGKKTIKKSFKSIFKFVIGLIESFELIKMNLDMDTHDYVCNAQLVPVFHFLNGKKGTFSINFNGDTNFQLILKNRLIKILKPAIIVATSK